MPRPGPVLAVVAVVIAGVVGGLVGGAVVASAVDARLAALETGQADLRAMLVQVQSAQGHTESRVAAFGIGVTRVKLTDEHEPAASRFGGIQAFVETGSTAPGCIASVSETNIGQYGPFYVLCTTRAPIIDGRQRNGLLIQIRSAAAGGSSGKMFPPGAIVELSLWQPGATNYASPVPCPIGTPGQC